MIESRVGLRNIRQVKQGGHMIRKGQAHARGVNDWKGAMIKFTRFGEEERLVKENRGTVVHYEDRLKEHKIGVTVGEGGEPPMHAEGEHADMEDSGPPWGEEGWRGVREQGGRGEASWGCGW
ncbi:hypothetical protein SUGI_1036350 [Cryptomeria japonica]|nr:hypothetical protein SUGI_1036350 [Cryptomeria japonica]